MTEKEHRKDIVRWGKSLFERGLTAGSSGNISVKLDDGFLFTPTNSCLGFLDGDEISKLDVDGKLISGRPPTKELPLHLAFYQQREAARAVVHLHSTYATALSCLADTDPHSALLPITPYVVMRVGTVPVVPYTMPGSHAVRPLIEAVAGNHPAVLLENHGPVVSAASLHDAVFAIEELEEAAKLALMLRDLPVRLLSTEAVCELDRAFKLK